MKSKFIVFEGGDGCGKSSVTKLISERLRQQNIKFISFREPGGCEISEKIRDMILDVNHSKLCAKTESLLYAASRAQLVEQKIKPALKEGIHVINDRYVLSSLFYQGVGRDLGIEQVKLINDFATSGLTADLTIYLDVDYEFAIKRKRKNFIPDRLEKEKDSFHKKVYDAYKTNLPKYCHNFKIINASKSLEEVVNDCYEEIIKCIGE